MQKGGRPGTSPTPAPDADRRVRERLVVLVFLVGLAVVVVLVFGAILDAVTVRVGVQRVDRAGVVVVGVDVVHDAVPFVIVAGAVLVLVGVPDPVAVGVRLVGLVTVLFS